MKSYRRRPSPAGANSRRSPSRPQRSSRWAGDDGDGGDGRPLLLWPGETQVPVPGAASPARPPWPTTQSLTERMCSCVMILCAEVCIRSPDQTVDDHRHNHHHYHADWTRCDDRDGCDGRRLLLRSENGQMPRQDGSFLARKRYGGRERSTSLPTACKLRFAGVCGWRPRAWKIRRLADLGGREVAASRGDASLRGVPTDDRRWGERSRRKGRN